MPGPHEEEEWACNSCGYTKNFSNRIACYACPAAAPDRYVKRARAASEKWLAARKDRNEEPQVGGTSAKDSAELAKVRKQLAAKEKELAEALAAATAGAKPAEAAEEVPDQTDETEEQKALCDELVGFISAHELSTSPYFVNGVADAKKKLAETRGVLRDKQPPRKQFMRAEAAFDKATKALAKATEAAAKLKEEHEELHKSMHEKEAKADEEVQAKARILELAEADLAEAIGRANVGGRAGQAAQAGPLPSVDPDLFGKTFLEFAKGFPNFSKESFQLVAEAMGGFIASVAKANEGGTDDRDFDMGDAKAAEAAEGLEKKELPGSQLVAAGAAAAAAAALSAAAAGSEEQYNIAVLEEAYSKLGRKGKLLEGKGWPRTKTFTAAEVHKDWTEAGWVGTVLQVATDLSNKKNRTRQDGK